MIAVTTRTTQTADHYHPATELLPWPFEKRIMPSCILDRLREIDMSAKCLF